MKSNIFAHPQTLSQPSRLEVLQAFTGRVAIPDSATSPLVRLEPRLKAVQRPSEPQLDGAA